MGVPTIKINAARVNEHLAHLHQFGLTADGGVTRYAYTPAEQAATEQVARWMNEAGLSVRRDAVGNLFGRLEGKRPGPAVLTGSHLDSVPHGGHYDGPLGVLGSLEAVQSMREQGYVPELPIEVVSLVGEEGSRFAHGLLGSSVLTGEFPLEEADRLRDRDGVTLAEAVRQNGMDPALLPTAQVKAGTYAAYVEMHIEQAGLLESHNLPVGIVTGIAGMHQLQGVIRGRAEHAGACPMELRRDPMPAAAEVILAVEQAARESNPATRATVGFVQAHPGASNVIPDAVALSFDIRDLDGARRDACMERIKSVFAQVCQRRGLTGEMELQHSSRPTLCDPQIMGVMESSARQLGLEPFRLPSGAVHDGANVAALCPVGMIFVRSRDGLSHCPQEFSSPEDIAAGTALLAQTLAVLAAQGV